MRDTVAAVKNIRLLSEAGHALRKRSPGVPGVGIVWGATGYGKTTAAAWLANKLDAIYVRARAVWTPSAMLAALMKELGASPKGSCSAMLDYCAMELSANPRPLFIDEADYLTRTRLLDTLRDIHDVSTTPIVLIGMADFRRRIAHREQLSGRISHWVEFRAADLDDARELAEAVCEVRIADDLLKYVHQKAKGSMRGMVVGLSRIETFARRRALEVATLDSWGNQPITLAQTQVSVEEAN